MSLSLPHHTVSQLAADKLLDAATAKAASMKLAMVIAIVDDAGALKAFRRMDGAPLLSVEIATDKAYTAAAYKIPTHAWFDFIKDDAPLLHGITHTNRLVVFGGGYPIELDGQVIGGIGVSGGHYSQDQEVAEAALAALK